MTNQNYKLEDGNGLILSSRELVHVQEVDILPLYQVPPSSSSEDITILEKQKDMPT